MLLESEPAEDPVFRVSAGPQLPVSVIFLVWKNFAGVKQPVIVPILTSPSHLTVKSVVSGTRLNPASTTSCP